MLYLNQIMKIVGCTLEQAKLVECYMLLQSGTLSSLSPAKFKREAKTCWTLVQMDPERAARLASTY